MDRQTLGLCCSASHRLLCAASDISETADAQGGPIGQKAPDRLRQSTASAQRSAAVEIASPHPVHRVSEQTCLPPNKQSCTLLGMTPHWPELRTITESLNQVPVFEASRPRLRFSVVEGSSP